MEYKRRIYRELDEPGAGGGSQDDAAKSRNGVRQALEKVAGHPGGAENAAGMSHGQQDTDAPAEQEPRQDDSQGRLGDRE